MDPRRIREAHEMVTKDEIGRLGIVQENLRKRQEFLQRVIAPVDGREESPCRMSAHIATVFLWRTTFGGYRRRSALETTERRNAATGGVRLVEANTNGERPTGYWWCSSVSMPMKRRSSKRTQRHEGNDNLVNVLNQAAGGSAERW